MLWTTIGQVRTERAVFLREALLICCKKYTQNSPELLHQAGATIQGLSLGVLP